MPQIFLKQFIKFQPPMNNKNLRKRGIVLPIVIVFMLISQVVYWGILRLNQLNSQQYLQFQSYYQDEIQHVMIEDILNDVTLLSTKSLENKVLSDLSIQHEVMKNRLNIIEWGLEENQVGWATLLSHNENEERIIIYRHSLYINDDSQDNCRLFETIYCEGVLNKNGTYSPFPLDNNNLNNQVFMTLKNQLINVGFILEQQVQRNAIKNWIFEGLPQTLFTFNTGSILLTNQITRYQLSSQLKQSNFKRSKSKQIEHTQFLIIWQGEIYSKNNPEL